MNNKLLLSTLAVVGLSAAAISQVPNRTPGQIFAQTTYGQVCAGCHAGGRAPNLFDKKLLDQRTDAQLRATIENGIPGTEMAGFKSTYSEEQIGDLIAFFRAHAVEVGTTVPAFEPDPDGKVIKSEKQTFRIEVVTRGLTTPWGMAFLPDGRKLVTERPGHLRIIDKDGKLLPQPVQGTPKVVALQDGGLLDVAIHPDYARNGWVYLSYSERLAGSPDPAPTKPGERPNNPLTMTVLVRGKINAQNQWVDQQLIWRAPPSVYTTSIIHYGSRFLFDHKGHLFFSLGERGDMTNAQNLGSPLGKIHRINDDGSVPKDNPFVGKAGAIPTIWSYGHRNPEGLVFDPVTGALWESEHGPSGGDEINVIVKGGNYGWGVVSMGMQPGITKKEEPGMINPVAWYTPTIAPSGITFDSGNRYPGWKNNLFVAGLAGQQLRRLEVADGKVVHQEILFRQFGRTREVSIGPDGYLYVLLQNPTGLGTGLPLSADTPGTLVRLVPQS